MASYATATERSLNSMQAASVRSHRAWARLNQRAFCRFARFPDKRPRAGSATFVNRIGVLKHRHRRPNLELFDSLLAAPSPFAAGNRHSSSSLSDGTVLHSARAGG